MILTALVIFVGGTVWTVFYSFTNSKLLPRLNFVGLDQYTRLWSTPRWLSRCREPGHLRRALADLLPGHRLHAGRAARPEDPLREHVPHDLPLPLRAVLHRHRPGLAVDPQSRISASSTWCAASAGRASPSIRSIQFRNRHLRHPDRRALAGHRPGHVPDAGRPARHRRGHLEGRRASTAFRCGRPISSSSSR